MTDSERQSKTPCHTICHIEIQDAYTHKTIVYRIANVAISRVVGSKWVLAILAVRMAAIEIQEVRWRDNNIFPQSEEFYPLNKTTSY